MSEWVSEWVGWVSELGEWVSEWVSELGEWVSEWVSEWVGWVSECVKNTMRFWLKKRIRYYISMQLLSMLTKI